ncbi:CAP domain-containing protein [Pseudomonas sp. LRF_L74]|uniref:CAP domain-containing protein n=1 Tax=Pseudomonas sp. LRF_L74 TaxID=3369422 RepID=UPI003F625775
MKAVRQSILRGLPILAALLCQHVVAADDAEILVRLINDYRQSPQTCAGKQTLGIGPLAPQARLAGRLVMSSEQLQDALRQAGYQPAAVQMLAVRGPANAASAMQALQQMHCARLLDPQYAQIGVLHSGNTWQVVLARPLLPANLGDWQSTGQAILKAVNEARASARYCGDQRVDAAAPLAWNQTLGEVALAHSREMALNNYFSHQGRDGSLAGQRATQAGYAWQRIGENIAAGQGEPQQVVAGWLASSQHCFNVMNAEFSEMGAAHAVNPQSDASVYWTQVFGAPR